MCALLSSARNVDAGSERNIDLNDDGYVVMRGTCVYVCVCAYACVYVYTCVSVYVYVNVCVYIMCVYMHVRVCSCKCICFM